MKTWMYGLALVVSLGVFADEVSQEEYLKEVNKAFDRVYQATDGKTLAQQIIVLNQLFEEYSSNEVVQDALLQEVGTTYSFLGKHQRALAAYDKREKTPEQLVKKVTRLSPVNAHEEVIARAKQHQILMINEAHHIPQHRVFTYRLLDELWAEGYRYFALEALSEGAENRMTEEYLSESAGFYTIDPIFANLILRAKTLGFQIVSYDYGSELSGGTEAREKSAVKNIREKVFDNDPNAKLLVHVGYSHISEDSWLAHYIKNSLEIDPLTVNQTAIREKSEHKFESKTYRWLTENLDFEHPIVLTEQDGDVWSLKPDKYDMNVIWPRSQYTLERPQWASLDRGLVAIDLNWCKERFPCTVEGYRVGDDEEVPSDRIAIYDDNTTTGLYLSEDTQLIKVTAPSGEVLHREEVGQ